MVGGLIGGGSTYSVQNCYTTGNVSGVRRIGGVVGINTSGTINNCVAFGQNISATAATASEIGRVSGVLNNLSGNNARDNMIVTLNGIIQGSIIGSHNNQHGADLVVNNTVALNSIFSAANGWDPTVWNIPGGNFDAGTNSPLPTLLGVGGTQNPVLP
jgi:hypothetical protein